MSLGQASQVRIGLSRCGRRRPLERSAYAEVSGDPEVASTAASSDDIAAEPSRAPNPERAGEVAAVACDRCDRALSAKCVSGEESGDQEDRLSAAAAAAGKGDRMASMN